MTAQSTAQAPDFNAQFDELRQLVGTFKAPPLRALVPLEWLNKVRNGWGRPLAHPRLALFAGVHGVAAPADSTALKGVMNNINNPEGRTNLLCRALNADLRLYELDLSNPTADFRTGTPAMTPQGLVMATSYGMMAVDPDIDLLLAHAIGAGLETSCAALHAARTKDDSSPTRSDAFDLLIEQGGFELCALLGSVIAAGLAHKPVLLEGQAGYTVLTLLAHMNPSAIAHCALILDPQDAATWSALPVPVFLSRLVKDAPGTALLYETMLLKAAELRDHPLP